MLSLKCVFVGDVGAGKTSLTMVLNGAPFDPNAFVPTVADNWAVMRMHRGVPAQLGLWDVNAREEYDRLRPLSYPQTDVFALCFDVTRPHALQQIRDKWHHEVQHHCPGVPVVLVGTKSDLLESQADADALASGAERDRTWALAAAWRERQREIGRQHLLWRVRHVWPLLRHVSPRVPPKDGQCRLDGLCDELVLHILGYLDTPDLGRVARVNRRLRELAGDRALWPAWRYKRGQVAGRISEITPYTVQEVARKIGARATVITSATEPALVVETLSTALLDAAMDHSPSIHRLTLQNKRGPRLVRRVRRALRL